MNYLHYQLDLGTDELVEVKLDQQANVRLLDEVNYDNYKNGKEFKYFGGLVTRSPTRLAVPKAGRWHVVIDLGGYTGSVRASVDTIQAAA